MPESHGNDHYTAMLNAGVATPLAWAKRMAPTLTMEDWRWASTAVRVRGGFESHTGEIVSYEKARALLAYRDEVARGLSATMVDALQALQRRGLWARGIADITTWGRVIAERARVLAAEEK